MSAGVTVDVDWAPDCAIDLVAETLAEQGVAATWFVTHASAALERLRERPDLFQLAVHPNFLAGSSHGATPEDVLAHCLELVPEARAMRTHCLYQWTRLFDLVLERTPIAVDVSIFLPGARGIAPVEHRWRGRTLLRAPYYWEDDNEMEAEMPVWRVRPEQVEPDGLRLFNFHPIHVFLNSPSMDAYRELLTRTSRLSDEPESALRDLVCRGDGTRTFFEDLVGRLAGRGSLRLSDVEAAAK